MRIFTKAWDCSNCIMIGVGIKESSSNLNAITLILDRLEKSGLLKKKRDLPDRRNLRVILTSKGKNLLSNAAIRYTEIPDEIMCCLSSEEVQIFYDLVHKMRERILAQLGTTETQPYRKDMMYYAIKMRKPSMKIEK